MSPEFVRFFLPLPGFSHAALTQKNYSLYVVIQAVMYFKSNLLLFSIGG